MDRLTGKLESQRHDHRQSPFCEGNGHNWCERKPEEQTKARHKMAKKIARIARGHQGNGRGGKGNRGERWERCTEGVHLGVWGPTCWHGAEKPRNHQTCNVGTVIWQLIRWTFSFFLPNFEEESLHTPCLLCPHGIHDSTAFIKLYVSPAWKHPCWICQRAVWEVQSFPRLPSPACAAATNCRNNKQREQTTRRTEIDSSHNSQKYKRTWASTKAPEIRTTARVSSPQSSHHLRKKTWIEAMRSSHDYLKTHNCKPLWACLNCLELCKMPTASSTCRFCKMVSSFLQKAFMQDTCLCSLVALSKRPQFIRSDVRTGVMFASL